METFTGDDGGSVIAVILEEWHPRTDRLEERGQKDHWSYDR